MSKVYTLYAGDYIDIANEDCIRIANLNPSLSNEEIQKDIMDTHSEVVDLTAKIWSFGWRLDSGYKSHIKERKEFILNLKAIIRGRILIAMDNENIKRS